MSTWSDDLSYENAPEGEEKSISSLDAYEILENLRRNKPAKPSKWYLETIKHYENKLGLYDD